ncbi:MAG: GGDEF and EAL domain-containing protein [Leptospiraceae bacterium]|nr:GGDEF and EAL domain-containing protein [Leptospiraceae bacterium]MDW7976418.1 GGDEF and EAL domain-containing protein [Leptospiraceae bacterium]
MKFKIKERILKNLLLELTNSYEQLQLDFHSLKNQCKEQIYRDHLTGLLNYDGFMKELKRIHQESLIENQRYGIIIYDIDDFRFINSYYGPDVGHILLISLAEYMKSIIPFNGIVARIGNNKGGIIIPNTNPKELLKISYELKQKLENYDFRLGDTVLNFTLSGGVSISDYNKSHKQILDESMNALLEAKASEKGSIKFFDETIQKKLDRLNSGKELILKILSNEGFIQLYVHPILSCRDFSIIGGEILLRLIVGDKIYSPNTFLESAIYFGLIDKLEEKVLSIISNLKLPLKNQIYLFVNKFLRKEEKIETLHNQLLMVENFLKNNNAKFVVEITENSLFENYNLIKNIMDYNKNLVELAIDDFGSGYTSLKHLYELNFSFLKIDGSLTKNIHTNQKALSILKGINEIARSLQLKVIVEHIENKEQVELCKELNIDYLQGYYFYQPMKIESFVDLVNVN